MLLRDSEYCLRYIWWDPYILMTSNFHLSFSFISLPRWDDTSKPLLFFLIFFNVYSFLKDRAQAGVGRRERGTQNLKQAPGSELAAQLSAQAGLELMNGEIMT